MKILAKMVGGSRAYGLETPTSDYDERFVFINTDLKHIIGLDKHEHQVTQNEEIDSQGFELRRFFQLLRKTNTQVLELLYNKNWLYLNPEFKCLVIDQKEKFLNTEALFSSLMGYIQGERRLMNGERTGKLGSKRKEAIDKYGYSYKNLVQIMRLCYVGMTFFKDRVYPVNIRESDSELAEILMRIKTHPEELKVNEANEIVGIFEQGLKNRFDDRDKSKDFKFDEDYANQVILQLYFPVVKDHFQKLV